jgi:uncharacterized repeat protein (TIGR04138 family)
MTNTELIARISEIVERDTRYHLEAYFFILAALEYTVSQLPEVRHLTGQELSKGIAEYACLQYGYLAKPVLEQWGVKTTLDYGEIVYVLIEEGVMSKTEGDRKEDFAEVYDFESEFAWERVKPARFPERFE